MHTDSSIARTSKPKSPITATIALALLAVALLNYGCSKPATGIVQSSDLGFGFRRVTIAKSEKGKVNQYPFFFYRDTPICQIGPVAPSISPSGNYGICQDFRTGKIVLFRRREEKIVPLTATAGAPASGFQWHENDNSVEVSAGKEGFASIFNLQ
jgi:hypothetical protein